MVNRRSSSAAVAPIPVRVMITFTITNRQKHAQVMMKIFKPTTGVADVSFNADDMVITLTGNYDVATVRKDLQEFREDVDLDSFNHVEVEAT